jgi:hypothetical protein
MKFWRRGIVYFFVLLLVGSALFLNTVRAREPTTGILDEIGYWHWLTGSTVTFSQNWFYEGAVNLGFSLLENPPSVEFPEIQDRSPYVSYPPGSIIPIHIMALIRGVEADPELIAYFNMTLQFLTGILLSLCFFWVIEGLALSLEARTLLSSLPFLYYTYLPGVVYFHQAVYFSDIAIPPFYVAVLLLEILRDRKPSRYGPLLQGSLMAYGLFTDWLMFFLIFGIAVKRWVQGDFGSIKNLKTFVPKTTRFLLPAFVSLSLFAIQIVHLNGFAPLLEKFFRRVGLREGDPLLPWEFLIFHYPNFQWGNDAGLYIFLFYASVTLASGYFFLFSKKGRLVLQKHKSLEAPIWFSFLLVLPCLIQIFLFSRHSRVHAFSVLKLSLSYSVIPFILGPLVALYFWKNRIRYQWAITGGLLLVSVTYLHQNYRFYAQKYKPLYGYAGRIIRQYTNYFDVAFSPTIQVPINPPIMLAHSAKRVYKTPKPQDLQNWIKEHPLNKPFNIVLIFPEEPDPLWDPILFQADFIHKEFPLIFRVNKDVILPGNLLATGHE